VGLDVAAKKLYMINIENEIKFKTARSSGSGGQHVNKVETMVEGFWHIEASGLCSVQEKQRIFLKLKNRINKEGFLLVKSQSERSQLANKEVVINKMKELVEKALIIPKIRKPTKPTKASKEKRIEKKKTVSIKKDNRRKLKADHY